MSLADLWFILVAVLWTGYFVLEGFDFGVGMLLPFLPRNDADRSTMFQSIGPVWDGNEVWLVMAGGATFAAFPAWYATMFSGFYLALLLVLFFLIIRVVSFEWRTKARSARWRTDLDVGQHASGASGPSLVWGVGLSALLYGVPIDSSGDFSGDFADLFNLYTVLGGISMVLLFAYHGATYLTIRTTGELCERAARAARTLSLVATVVGAGFLAWTVAVAVDRNDRSLAAPLVVAVLGIAALVLSVLFAMRTAAAASRSRSTAIATALVGRDAVHEPLPARDGVEH